MYLVAVDKIHIMIRLKSEALFTWSLSVADVVSVSFQEETASTTTEAEWRRGGMQCGVMVKVHHFLVSLKKKTRVAWPSELYQQHNNIKLGALFYKLPIRELLVLCNVFPINCNN